MIRTRLLAKQSLINEELKSFSEELIKKLYGFLSVYQKKEIQDTSDLIKTADINKTLNKEVLSNIEIISEAIKTNKQIKFLYYGYDVNGQFVPRKGLNYYYYTNPYYIICKDGKYYLLGNIPGTPDLATYRLDYIIDVQVTDISLTKIRSLKKYSSKPFNLNQYINEHIYLTNGDVCDGELILHDAQAIRAAYDWFGTKSVKMRKENDMVYATIRSDENALYYWCMQYAEHISVKSPISLVKRMQDAANLILRSSAPSIVMDKSNPSNEGQSLKILCKKCWYIPSSDSQRIFTEQDLNDYLLNFYKCQGNYKKVVGQFSVIKSEKDNLKYNYDKNDLMIVNCDNNTHFTFLALALLVKSAQLYNIESMSNGSEDRKISHYVDKYFKRGTFVNDFQISLNDENKIELVNTSLSDSDNSILKFFIEKINDCIKAKGNKEIESLFMILVSSFLFIIKNAN